MSILITGGTGFIGSHTVVELIEAGETPIIVDNLCNSKEIVLDRIETITGKRPKMPRPWTRSLPRTPISRASSTSQA